MNLKLVAGAMTDVLTDFISGLVPQKTFEKEAEALGTRTVYYSRRWGVEKYVYGKRPDEPYLPDTRTPDVPLRPYLSVDERMRDPFIQEHIAICSREEGSRGGLCEMCRKLNNPKRFDFLLRLYRDKQELRFAGFNVGEAEDKSELNQSATSEYLRQLADLGLVKRQRNGRIVHYSPDLSAATPWVREIAVMMRTRILSGSEDLSFRDVFPVLMGVFRATVVRYLASGGDGRVTSLAERYGKKPREMLLLLKPAVRGLLLELDSEDEGGIYRYVPPMDPIARRIVELS